MGSNLGGHKPFTKPTRALGVTENQEVLILSMKPSVCLNPPLECGKVARFPIQLLAHNVVYG